MAHEETVAALLRELRVAAWRVAAINDALYRELGLTGAMRDVLGDVGGRGGQTVPQLARAAGVSRQHVQTLVDRLAQAGLCAFVSNPQHRRSPLVQLTPKGQAVLDTVRECERASCQEIATELPADVPAGLSVLRRLNAALLRRLA